MFSLAGMPEVGKFDLVSSSWEFLERLRAVMDRLRLGTGQVLCTLRMEPVGFTTSSGLEVSYRRPTLVVDGPVGDSGR
ncbi:hypothetical protein GCM10010341_83370 [Streptomyces noursei]|nr:hypothetical protein GCM10010341_83370 [Streptomyces noursei]